MQRTREDNACHSCDLWSVVCGLWSVVCGLWSVVWGLWVVERVDGVRSWYGAVHGLSGSLGDQQLRGLK